MLSRKTIPPTIHKLFLICNLLFVAGYAYSQNRERHILVRASAGSGKIIPNKAFFKGDNLKGESIEGFRLYSLQFLLNNPGYDHFQRTLASPYYGVGFSYGDIIQDSELGNPVSAYSIIGIPIARFNRFAFFSESQFGLSGNWKPYDQESNPRNFVIGSKVTFKVATALKLFYHASPKIDLGLGLGFLHYSNGAIKYPNTGVNARFLSFDMGYRFRDRPDYKKLTKPVEVSEEHELNLSISFGATFRYQAEKWFINSPDYKVFGLSIGYLRHFFPTLKSGISTDLNYVQGHWTKRDFSGNIGNLLWGIAWQNEVLFHKVRVVAGYGIYVNHLDYGTFKVPYQKIGVKYDLLPYASLGVVTRARSFSKADFTEFGLFYNLLRSE